MKNQKNTLILHHNNWKELIKFTLSADWYLFEETKDLSMLEIPNLFIIDENAELETVGAIKYPKTNKNTHVSILPFPGHTLHLDKSTLFNWIIDDF